MQQPPKLIAIHGLKGSGKDLTAKMLKKYALNSDTFAFGDKLKRICVAATGIPLLWFYDEALKEAIHEFGLSPRVVMTQMQGPLKDLFGDDFFAIDVVKAWRLSQQKNSSLIVTDLRYQVELKVLRDLGAEVLHVQRPDTGMYTGFTHSSEQGLPLSDLDRLLDNSRDKPYLMQQVRNVVKDLWGASALHAYPFHASDCSEFN